MNNFTISIFENKTFFKILKEINLFSEFKIKHYENLIEFNDNKSNKDQIVIFFKNNSKNIEPINFPSIFVTESNKSKNKLNDSFKEEIKMPFSILDFKEKIISIISKNEFKKNSLINLNGYTIDKNQRKIKKENVELQLSEKEVEFLILFSKSKEPIKRDFVLKKVWNYSKETETHTVETHIHRLRKKILEKFKDNNFIKNNKKGYYI